MADCELIEKCIFFNNQMANMPSTTSVYKKLYCTGDFANCARFRVCKALGRERVPADLFPNQVERASQMING